MSKTRIWVLGAVAAMLVIVIGGWVLGISPIFNQITEADAQTTTIQSANTSSQAQLASLKTQFAGISSLQTQLDALRLSVPEDQSASEFLNEINSLSADAGTTVKSVVISDATLYTAPATTSTTTTTTTTTSTPAPTTPTTTPTTPVVTANGLVLIPVSVTVDGTLAQAQSFFGALQTGSRLFVSSNLLISSDSGSDGVTAQIIGDIFTLQGSSDPTTSTTTPTDGSTAYPTPTATATPTPTETPTPTPTSSNKSSKTGTSKPSPTPTPSSSVGTRP